MGRTLVDAFNAFYYSWSPPVARTVGSSSFLQAVFRILLLPVVLGVHAAALLFAAISGMTGSADAASVVAFVLAASLCVIAYVALPVAVSLGFVKTVRRSRREPPT